MKERKEDGVKEEKREEVGEEEKEEKREGGKARRKGRRKTVQLFPCGEMALEHGGIGLAQRAKSITSPGVSVECCPPCYLCARFPSFTMHTSGIHCWGIAACNVPASQTTTDKRS